MVSAIVPRPCARRVLFRRAVSGLLLELNGTLGFTAWQWLFLVEGLLASVVGVWAFHSSISTIIHQKLADFPKNTTACNGGFRYRADHIGRLGLKVGIVRHYVGIETMRPNVVLAPDTLHRHERHAQLRGQLAAAPVRRAVSRFTPQCVVEHSHLKPRQVTAWRTT